MGTPDGTTVTGVETFFCLGPYVTSGTGTVTVINADGVDSITGPHQAYYLASQLLPAGDTTPTRNWQIQLSAGVTGFNFGVCVFTDFPAEYSTPATAPSTTPDSIYASVNMTKSDPSYSGSLLENIAVIDFLDTASLDSRALAVAKIGGTVVGGTTYLDSTGFYLVRVVSDSTGAALERALDSLTTLAQVDAITPEFLVDTAQGLDYRRPSDSTTGAGWILSPGQAFGPDWGLERIAAPLAWGCDTGSASTAVAVLDEGFMNVADLTPNVANSPTYLPTTGDRHGTAVASVVGARGNNGIGMTGTMWVAGLHLFSRSQPASAMFAASSDIAMLARAAQSGARVVNLSGALVVDTGSVDSTNTAAVNQVDRITAAMDTALGKVDRAGFHPLYVFSAGNQKNNAFFNSFPTLRNRFPLRVLVVESTSSADVRSSFSNRGSLVTIAAPGESVLSLDRDDGAKPFTGTSALAPLVAGVAGLLFAFDSALSADQVDSLIVSGAVNGGRRSSDTTPILNAYQSLKLAAQRTGFPLCGNRVWAAGGTVFAQRASGAEALFSISGPAWSVMPMHGGHRIEYTTAQGRYSSSFNGASWSTPTQVQDSATAANNAPSYAEPPQSGSPTLQDTIAAGTDRSMWAFNHDADSAVLTLGSSDGTTITYAVVRTSTVNIGSGPYDTVGTVSFPVSVGNQMQDDTVCTVNQPGVGCMYYFVGQSDGRQDNLRLAYAPQGDAILLAIDQDTIYTTFGTPYSCSTSGSIVITGLTCIDATIHTASYQTQLHQWSLPSKTHTTLTAPSGQDVWWWGISEDDSTIVAGIGQRNEQYVQPARRFVNHTRGFWDRLHSAVAPEHIRIRIAKRLHR